jgi:hypothetical protein
MKLRRLMQGCPSRTKPTRGQHGALQQNWPADDRSGSVASHPDLRDVPGMSAMPPIATQSVRRNEASRCANKRHMRRNKSRSLNHLVGASEHNLSITDQPTTISLIWICGEISV